MSLIGFDLAPRLCGWAAGSGEGVPEAGCIKLSDHGKDDGALGKLGAQFQAGVMSLHRRFPASHWICERPLLMPHDARWTLMRTYGLTCLLATIAEKLGVAFCFVDYDEAKIELAGTRKASKADMVFVAEKLGVALPPTKGDGREDAADATAVWKVGVRLFAPQYLKRLDQALYSTRGGLI